MRSTVFDSMISSIADAGRELLTGRIGSRRRSIAVIARDLISSKGDASGAALARELIEAYRRMSAQERREFFELLARDYALDAQAVIDAAQAYRDDPGKESMRRLHAATEHRRQEFFRRMNLAPGGTRALVRMRADLLEEADPTGEFGEIDVDLHHLLSSWFNPGFLSLTRIDWDSPASLLEKLVRYEKVHKMRALEDLKRRLAADRRCFAFFHPALPDEPLIFVQVALVKGMAAEIPPLIRLESEIARSDEANTAIFYSISNCQPGLRGVTLGNFLIKGVVETLKAELSGLDRFATLSPIPGFAGWLARERANDASEVIRPEDEAEFGALDLPGWHAEEETAERLKPILLRLCAHYLVRAKRGSRPEDSVARFHLGNGARLERINWMGDPSENGLAQSFGMLVNYAYDPSRIEANHEAFVTSGEVIVSSAVKKLLPGVQPARAERSLAAGVLEN